MLRQYSGDEDDLGESQRLPEVAKFIAYFRQIALNAVRQ
jgi:hypothetical protein